MKLLPVRTRSGSGFVDESGAVCIPLAFNECHTFSEGLARVRIGDVNPGTMGCEYGKQGFIDESGKLVIPAEYPRAGDFSEGLAVFYVGSHYGGGGWVLPAPWEGGKAGYLNKNGEVVIEPQFDQADAFEGGIARVCKDRKWGFINTRGEYVIEPVFDGAKPFSCGLACVNIGKRPDETRLEVSGERGVTYEQIRHPGKWGYIDKKGELVIEPRYREAASFSEGRAWVYEYVPIRAINFQSSRRIRGIDDELNAAFGSPERFPRIMESMRYLAAWSSVFICIDTKGRLTVKKGYREAYEFSGGLALVYESKCGYIDANGATAIKFEFEEGFSFAGDYARVIVDDKQGLIDRSGRFVLPPSYDELKDATENLVAFKDAGKWGYFDIARDVKISPQFKEAEPFQDGLAWVKVGEYQKNGWFISYIDHTGRLIWTP